MKPLQLTMSAFGPYASEQSLDFADLKGRKFFLIHGATGAGKTTILDAICYALYGSATSDLREAKALRSDHADPLVLTEVSFTFAIGNEVYRVRRSPRQERPKKKGDGVTEQQPEAELYKIDGEKETLLEAKYENVTRKITDLLGFQCSQFRQVVLLPQGEFRKLLVAKSEERQQIMKMLFKTELYQRIEEHLKKKAKEKADAIKAIYEKKEWLLAEAGTDSLASLEETIAKLKIETETANKKLQTVQIEYQQAQEQLNEANLVDQKFKEYESAKEAFGQVNLLLSEMEAKRSELVMLERAEKLAEAEKIVWKLQQDSKQYQEAEVKQKQAVEITQQKVKDAQTAFQVEREKEAERQSLDNQILKLKEYVKQTSALTETKKAWQDKAAVAKKTLVEKNKVEEKLANLEADLQKMLELEQGYLVETAKVDSYKMQVDALSKAVDKHQQLSKVQKEISRAKNLVQQLQLTLDKVREERQAMQTELGKMQHLFNIGQAGLLAKELKTGEPCPVCGAKEHLKLAVLLEDLPTQQTIDALQEKVVQLEEKQAKSQADLQQAMIRQETLVAQNEHFTKELAEFASFSLEELRHKANIAKQQYETTHTIMQKLAPLKEKIARYKESQERGAKRQKEMQEAFQRADGEAQALQAVFQEREQSVPEEYRELEVLQTLLREGREKQLILKESFERAQQGLQAAKEAAASAIATLQSLQMNLKQIQTEFETEKTAFYARMEAEGFADFSAYVQMRQQLGDIPALRDRLLRLDRSFAAGKERVKRAKAAIQGFTQPNLEEIKTSYHHLQGMQAQAIGDLAKFKLALEKQQKNAKQIHALEAELMKMQTENGVLAKLYQVTRGDNKFSMNLQRFVLGSLLEQVTEAANVMLKTMSKSRYLLQRTTDVARKGSASGLDLEVFDNHTGIARSVATLSGGETFLASLALALGLADVVQQYAGGIRLDTIFVDEGFGTLDPESLDMALNTLIELQNGGRLVGIISHVPELKERIDARLQVSIGKHGSSAKFYVG